jgi:hypothetical protein
MASSERPVASPDDKSSSQEFKTARRKEIEDAGLIIIVNVGDQYSDLRGGQTGLAG